MSHPNGNAGAILALEMEINIIEEDLECLNLDIEYLKNLQKQYIQSIGYLKKEKVITSIYEYKKILYEFSAVEQKIASLKNTIFQLDKKMEIKLKALDYYQKEYDKELEYLSRKILPFERNQNDNKQRETERKN